MSTDKNARAWTCPDCGLEWVALGDKPIPADVVCSCKEPRQVIKRLEAEVAALQTRPLFKLWRDTVKERDTERSQRIMVSQAYRRIRALIGLPSDLALGQEPLAFFAETEHHTVQFMDRLRVVEEEKK